MYAARAIANYFLNKARRQNVPIDQMKLQKLVYFAHGYFLAIADCPLLNERVEAWQYGPVIRSIYKQFRQFGNLPISGISGMQGPSIDSYSDKEKNALATQVLDIVWDIYGGLTGIQLANLTHQPDTPWCVVRNQEKAYISDELIKNFFLKELNVRSA
jgi:uncharacterized phage-associated protein